MKKNLLIAGSVIAVAIAAIVLYNKYYSDPKPPKPPCDNPPCNEALVEEDSIVNSFVFVGCNRLWYKDLHTNKSSANVDVLKNIFKHVVASGKKTDYFFFLGDIVNGEDFTATTVDQQLSAWNTAYNRGNFSDFKSSGIPLIAVPGNHEMLNRNELPLDGTTEAWMKHMGKFMPTNRDKITGSTAAVNQMTYGFKHDNIGFIVMNTDTYNQDYNKEQKKDVGVEGQIPYDWVKTQVAKYNSDPSVEHIFVMGHRPFYTQCSRDISHRGMPDSTESSPVWRSFQDNNVASMLSAHVHQYQRMQPDRKTYQLIAGNGGSPAYDSIPPAFFGYTRINVWSNGRIQMISEGYDSPARYNDVVRDPNWSVRDSLFDMNWYRSGAPKQDACECVTGE